MKKYRVYQGSRYKGSDILDMAISLRSSQTGYDIGYRKKKNAMKLYNQVKHLTYGWKRDELVTWLVQEDTEDEDVFEIIAEHVEAIK